MNIYNITPGLININFRDFHEVSVKAHPFIICILEFAVSDSILIAYMKIVSCMSSERIRHKADYCSY